MQASSIFLIDLLKKALTWHQPSHGKFVALVKDANNLDNFVTVSTAELSTLHSSLPETLQALFLWSRQSLGKLEVENRSVVATLDLLNSDVTHMVDNYGKNRVFTDISTLGLLNEASNFVWLRATEFDVKTVDYFGKSLSLVVSSTISETIISRDYLEKAYPGWKERWELGKELGIDNKTLLNNVFGKDKSASTMLDGISFDS